MLAYIIVYVLVALLGVFVITPVLKARGLVEEFFIDVCVFASVCWPLTLVAGPVLVVLNYILFKPGVKLFDKAVNYFTPVKLEPQLNEAKSNYRTVKFKE